MNQQLKTKITSLLPDGINLMGFKEEPHRGMVRCIVDSENSITLEHTSQIAKTIKNSGVLDLFYPNGISLEVSTPGISEPLTEPFQYIKNIGRMLEISFNKNGFHKTTQAVLTGFDGKILYLNNKHRGHFQLSFEEIIKTTVKVQFT